MTYNEPPWTGWAVGSGGRGGIESADVPEENEFAVFGRSGSFSGASFGSVLIWVGSSFALAAAFGDAGGADDNSCAAVWVTSLSSFNSFASVSTSI